MDIYKMIISFCMSLHQDTFFENLSESNIFPFRSNSNEFIRSFKRTGPNICKTCFGKQKWIKKEMTFKDCVTSNWSFCVVDYCINNKKKTIFYFERKKCTKQKATNTECRMNIYRSDWNSVTFIHIKNGVYQNIFTLNNTALTNRNEF